MDNDLLYSSAFSFSQVLNCSYHFVVSFRKRARDIKLTFSEKDFFHLAGLQYYDDIAISKNKRETIKLCLNHKITDDMIKKSKKYSSDLESRIAELQYLEKYLDTDNYIRIFELSKSGSRIASDYVIESKIKKEGPIVYIFLKKRNKDTDEYCVNSFFCKSQKNYTGPNMYWMLKEKIIGEEVIIIYQHPNYKRPDE